MNDNTTAASLSDLLGQIGLSQAARDRVVEIDRILANELAGHEPDAESCASLILEAGDLIADLDPPGFDFDGVGWGHE